MLANQDKVCEQEGALTLAKNKFLKDAIYSTATACNNINHKDFDIEREKKRSENDLIALRVGDGLQAMIAAQMLAIHKLQQTSMVLANAMPLNESNQYYTNTAIKLANTFVQQANLLAKLQGVGGQKIIIERVDISNGGQAVIGNVNSQERQ